MEVIPATDRFNRFKKNASVYITASILLILAAFTFALISSYQKRGSPALSKGSELLLQGDIFIRLGYAAPEIKQSFVSKAVNSYKNAASYNVPAAVRRLSLIDAEGLEQTSFTFERLLSKEVKAAAAEQAVKYPAEVKLWKRVYGNEPVSSEEAEKIIAQIHKLNLGPLRPLAVARVYELASMADKAEYARHSLVKSARIAWVALGLVAVFGGLLALTGLVVLIIYLVKPAKFSSGMLLTNTEPGLSAALWASFTVFLIVFLIFSDLPAILLKTLLPENAAENLLGYFSMSFYLAAGIISLCAVKAILGADTLRTLGLRTKSVSREVFFGLGAYGVSLHLMIVALAVSNLIFGKSWKGTEIHPVVFYISDAGPMAKALIFFVIAIAAPIVEEIFFRGILLNALRARFSPGVSVLISSLAFAAIHPQLPTGFLPLFALACGFGAVTVLRGSLLPAIIAHGINNSLIFIITVSLM